ncbi:MAG: hypothetical protein HZB16_16745 [Armatimonadetes bacterium]|nr:hypothetical protein [Armatimonadota bacterium]
MAAGAGPARAPQRLGARGGRRGRSAVGGHDEGGAMRSSTGAMLLTLSGLCSAVLADGYADRVATVTRIPGFVALWDFVQREPDGSRRFVAHRPPGETNSFALDAANYVREFWNAGREATYDDFPLLGRGPFGQAIRLRAETDRDFRPMLVLPRARFHDSDLDIKGPGRSVTLVAWVIRESGNHAVAGIWHEGTDLRHEGAAAKVQRGMRQYALFAGLEYPGAACGHVSENGAASFGDIYAHHKPTTGALMATVPGDSPPEVLGRSWSTIGLTFDNERDEAAAWLNGVVSPRWDEAPIRDRFVTGAWSGAPACPPDQRYRPPETKTVSVNVVSETDAERVELREYPYSKIKVTLRRAGDAWTEAGRELVAVRKNPWWFPYDIHTPSSPELGGPFTIGRVVHMGRSVGFTGYIGGVAVFGRALTAAEMAALADLGRTPIGG